MRELTYREAIREALREEMRKDKDVFLLGEDIAEFGGTYKVYEGLLDEFGKDRVRNTPISEAAIAGAAIGAAICGMRPVCEIMYTDFITIAMDQIVNQAAKIRYMTGGQVSVPVVIRTQGGGGRSGASHHSQSFEAWFLHVPGLRVIMPSTPYDAKGLMKAAIREDNPVLYIEHKLLYVEKGSVPEEEYELPIGKADIKREGGDITVVTNSLMTKKALVAAEELSKNGIDIEVVDLRSLSPLDKDTIFESVKKTGKLLIVHEGCEQGGIGGEITALVIKEVFDYIDIPIERLATKNTPIPFAPLLESYVIPQVEDIVEKVKEMMEG